MRHFTISIDVDASPERVWAILSDVERWEEWTQSVRSIRRLDAGPLRVGARMLVRQPMRPPATWEVVGLDEGRRVTLASEGPGIRVYARHGVAVVRGRTRATLSLEFAGFLGALVGRLTRGIHERHLALEARGIKMRGESPYRLAPPMASTLFTAASAG